MLRQAWDALKAQYETLNPSRILFLRTKLNRVHMNEDDTVDGFLTKVKVLRDKLRAVGERIRDVELVQATMSGMITSYQMFMSDIASRERLSTFEELHGILLQEEQRRELVKSRLKQ